MDSRPIALKLIVFISYCYLLECIQINVIIHDKYNRVDEPKNIGKGRVSKLKKYLKRYAGCLGSSDPNSDVDRCIGKCHHHSNNFLTRPASPLARDALQSSVIDTNIIILSIEQVDANSTPNDDDNLSQVNVDSASSVKSASDDLHLLFLVYRHGDRKYNF